MLRTGRIDVWTAILLLCGLAAAYTHSTNDTTPSVTSTASTLSGPSPLVFLPSTSSRTCPSRTINYITHTLPQQCLRTSRSALGNSANNTSSDGQQLSNGTVTVDSLPSGSRLPAEPGEAQETPPQADASIDRQASHSDQSGAESASTNTSTDNGSQNSTPSTTDATLESDLEHDSPLDTSKFLSFEEWKKQNLAKVGQSPENVGQGRPSPGGEGRRRPIHNALDSLGDEEEIAIDFVGFGGGERADEQASRWTANVGSSSRSSDAAPSPESLSPANQKHRSKDAGKTCKERFNYASFDCAATVLKTNPQCKSASSILVENKDSYMLNECSAESKHIIIELCDDILVDTIVLANFEFFSSMFRTFKVSVSDRYPIKLDRWKELGIFEARNSREIQAFLVENPLIWARYLKIEFLTHYGNEFYCPVSLVRVHGTTMMEEFRHQDESARGYYDIEDEVAEPEVQPAVSQEQQESEQVPKTPEPVAVTKEDTVAETQPANATLLPPDIPNAESNVTGDVEPGTFGPSIHDSGIETSMDSAPIATKGGPEKIAALLNGMKPAVQSENASSSSTSVGKEVANTVSSKPQPSPVQGPDTSSTGRSSASDSSTTSSEKKGSEVTAQGNGRTDGKPARTSPDVVRPPPSVSQQQSPQPTTQESFFKSTNKRLMMLETNSSLNIQYIEEQSRILRDAFIQTEKQQLKKTEKFLEHLNDTVMAELKGFRQQYDQLWQSTVIELETHREQYQREMLAISSRLTIMADELIFQKRMIVVQSTLLLLCLGLVIFVRSGSTYMELPLMQQVMNKSHSMLGLSFDSPPGSPSSRVSSPLRKSRRLVRQFSGTSEGSLGSPSPDRHGNPGLLFSPPTPSDGLSERSRSPTLSPEEAARVRETRSGPATPSGTREMQNPLDWEAARSVAESNTSSSLPRSSDPPARDSKPSSLRYSGSSEFDEEMSPDEGTADKQEGTIEKRRRGVPRRATDSDGSSNDGDTMAEMFLGERLSD